MAVLAAMSVALPPPGAASARHPLSSAATSLVILISTHTHFLSQPYDPLSKLRYLNCKVICIKRFCAACTYWRWSALILILHGPPVYVSLIMDRTTLEAFNLDRNVSGIDGSIAHVI